MTAKQQLLLLILLILFIATTISLVIILPSLRTILSLEKDITQTERFLEQQYQKTQRLRRSTHAIDDVLAQTDRYARSRLPEGEELRIIGELEELAKTLGVDQTLSVDFTLSEDTVGTYYSLSFLNRGPYQNVLAYLQTLEQMSYYFIIDSVVLERHEQAEAASMAMRFTAKLYTSPSL